MNDNDKTEKHLDTLEMHRPGKLNAGATIMNAFNPMTFDQMNSQLRIILLQANKQKLCKDCVRLLFNIVLADYLEGNEKWQKQ